MKNVSKFEADLLRQLSFFLDRTPLAQVLHLFRESPGRPRCLSRNAIVVVQDMLAKGCMLWLLREGHGWRVERFLRGDQVRIGRLWQRTPPSELGLAFSRHTLDFLIWFTATNLTDEKRPAWQAPPAEVTPADLFLFFLAHQALRNSEVRGLLSKWTPFNRNGLTWLLFPEDFADNDAVPDVAPWTTGLGAFMLEAMQPLLATRWLQIEHDKGRLVNWQDMRGLGQAQNKVLDAFLTAVEAVGRLDLARFLPRVASDLLTPNAEPDWWVGNLAQAGQRLADRAETYRCALAFVRQLERLQGWERRARSIGYFDEGYTASQLWKADWEQYQGDELTQRAQNIIRQLDPLRQTEG